MILCAVIAATLLLAGTLVAGAAFYLTETDRRLKLGFGGLVAIGCAAAVWCAFYVGYQPSPTVRILGVTSPTTAFQLENGNWVPFEGSGWISNLVIVVSVVAMPLSIPLLIRGIRRRRAGRLRGFPVRQRHG